MEELCNSEDESQNVLLNELSILRNITGKAHDLIQTSLRFLMSRKLDKVTS